MIKIILGVVLSVFVVVSTIIVLYWRDSQHDPSGLDLFLFFVLIPLSISVLILAPFLIRKWMKDQEEKKKIAEAHAQNQEVVEEIPPHQIEWLSLNVFSTTTLSAFGENESIWDELQNFKSPELDTKLLNGYGLPILSYRIAEIDDLMEGENEEEEFASISARQQRIEKLIVHQLEQNTETLWHIASHLQQSALFYETQLAHEYRMHPAWIDPNAEMDDDVESPYRIEQVPRLNRLNVHVILSEDLLHLCDEAALMDKFASYFDQLGIIAQKFHVELHYWGKEVAYKSWINLLQQIQQEDDLVSYIVAVDSEIDQDTIDEKTWVTDQYLPSEFVGSCCIAKPSVQINAVLPQKVIKIALNETKLFNTLEQLEKHELAQYEQEHAFVIQLDDMTDLKVIKRLEKNFAQTPIEQHHYIYMKPSVGQTENIAKIFGFMVALQAPDELLSMVYCCDLPQTQSLIEAYQQQEIAEEATV